MVPRISATVCVEYVVEEAMIMQPQSGRVLLRKGKGADSKGKLLVEEGVLEH